MDNPNRSFLRHVASLFKNDALIGQRCFVFPNRRAGLFFRKHLAAFFDRPVFSPAILTIDECFHELCPLQTEHFLPLILRLYTVYKQLSASPEPVDRFLYWGKLLLQDFSELDNHLTPNIKELFTSISDLNDIDRHYDYLSENQKKAIYDFWGVVIRSHNKHINASTLNNEDNPTQQFIDIWDKLHPLYTLLRESLYNDNRAYEGMIHRHVIEHWGEIEDGRKRPHYAFVAFNALTNSERELMKRLQGESRAEFYFDYSKKWLNDPDNKASLFKKHNIETFGQNMPLKDMPVDPTLPQITVYATSSTVAETHKMYEILTRLYPPDGENNDFIRTAIILPNEKMLIPTLHAIPEHINKMNVTMGFPLNVTPHFSLLQNMQKLQENKKNNAFYHRDALSLLAHPLIQQQNKTTGKISDHIKNKNITYVSPNVFVEQAGGDAERLQPVFRIIDEQDVTGTLNYVREVFSNLPDSKDGTKDIILTQLNLLERNITKYPCVTSQRGVFLLLITLLENQSIPYTGEPLEGLQIMGILESRALDFDNVIILGFNDDIYPGKIVSHSFIPMTLRRGFGLPTPERQDAIFAYNFYKLILYAKNVFLLYSNNAEEKTSSEPSRFLWQLQLQYKAPIKYINVVPEYIRSQNDTIIRKDKTEADINLLRNKLRDDGISPTWVKTYIQCPMLFCWRYVRQISEPDEVADIVTPLQLGTIFHSIMQRLYEPYIGQTLSHNIIEHIREDFIRQWEQPSQQMRELTGDIEQQHLVKKVLFNYVCQQLDRDITLTPFSIVALEKEYKTVIAIKDMPKAIIKGKIDRIENKQNTIRLVDYKTGEVKTNIGSIAELFVPESNNANPNALQVIFYCLLYEDQTDLLLSPHLYSLKSNIVEGKEGKTEIRINNNEFDYAQIKPEFIDLLRKTLEDISDETTCFEAAFGKDKCETCQFCPLCKNLL